MGIFVDTPFATEIEADDHRGLLTVGQGWKVPYYRTVPLTGSKHVVHAIVGVHGNLRRPDQTFTGLFDAARAAHATRKVAIVTPFFQTNNDEPAEDEARWTSAAWKEGGEAEEPYGLSSFTVMDGILRSLADKEKFPRLRSIALVGHSAGGQFTQRYAAAGEAPTELSGVRIRYVVANPSSYLYLSNLRPDLSDPTATAFDVPDSSCPEYNDYKYGLRNLDTHYLRKVGAREMRARYLSRNVTYLLGSADVERDSELDTEPAAELQGAHRFDRGLRYTSYLRTYFPSAPHQRLVVPGVAHENAAMFASRQARSVLFA